MKNVWKNIPGIEAKYWDALSAIEATSQSIIFSCVILENVRGSNNAELLSAMTKSILDSFIKLTISTKVKPHNYVVELCTPLLKHLTHEEFKGLLLPAVLKAMLRNPEIILCSVGKVLSILSLDLSPYSSDLGKPIAASLHSKEDMIREEAVVAAEALAKQCSEVEAVGGLLNVLFGVLQGSEGKLTVASHKISVLDGIGKLSKHSVTGAGVHKLSCDAIERFVKVLESEVHEATIIKAVDVLSLWTSRLTGLMPKSLIDSFKKTMLSKTATAAVRTQYIRCMSISCHGESLPQAAELVLVLLKSLERASTQPTQVAVVAEGLTAVTLLLRCVVLNEKVSIMVILYICICI